MFSFTVHKEILTLIPFICPLRAISGPNSRGVVCVLWGRFPGLYGNLVSRSYKHAWEACGQAFDHVTYFIRGLSVTDLQLYKYFDIHMSLGTLVMMSCIFFGIRWRIADNSSKLMLRFFFHCFSFAKRKLYALLAGSAFSRSHYASQTA
jgi:hypothetical protein